MKNLTTVAIFAFIALFCANGANATTVNDDPTEAITTFVNTYFPKASVLNINSEWDEYEVRLSDGTKLEFRLNLEWKQIDCKHSTLYPNVPAELVPEQIKTYVSSSFPNALIRKIERKILGWEIKLSNGLEVKFNNDFVVTEIDD